MITIEITMSEAKEFLADLIGVVERMEKVANLAKSYTQESSEKEEPKAALLTPKTTVVKASKKAKPVQVVEDETFDLEESSDTEAVDDEPAVTLKDVIMACKANREKAIKALKKMKVSSVHELKPAAYPKLLAEIGG